MRTSAECNGEPHEEGIGRNHQSGHNVENRQSKAGVARGR